MEAALALSRLPGLRRDAATAYASITAAEDALRALAGRRVASERSLRAATQRYQAAANALDRHARAKPGLRASLSTRLGARQEWRARQGALDAALRDRASLVSTAQRASAQVQAQFAAAVHARAEAAATLRRLTAECAAAQEAITRGRQRWSEHFPSGPEFFGAPADGDAAAEARRELTAPWADPEFAAARAELFLAALALHKALITAQARRIRGNLNAGRRCSSSSRSFPRPSRRCPRCSAASARNRLAGCWSTKPGRPRLSRRPGRSGGRSGRWSSAIPCNSSPW
jgi:hypothetical protein